MSIILYVYFAFVILLFTSITVSDPMSNTNYKVDSIHNLENPSNYLENRVDLNYDNVNALTDNVDPEKVNEKNNENSRIDEGGGIIDKLKGVWNKILHPSKYDKETYTDTLNSLHAEIFNYLNEDKLPRSLQPVNLVCNVSDPNNSLQLNGTKTPPTNATAKPLDKGKSLTGCSTHLQKFTVEQLNYLKKFLKCVQLQQQGSDPTKDESNKPSNKCECETTTTKKPPAAKAKAKSKSKPKVDSGAHSHNINEHPLNHTALDADKACSYNLYLNKLKFLAHLHHTVYQVGKKNVSPIDLNKIQAMIDDAKGKLQMANESLNTYKTKDEAKIKSDSPEVMFPFFNPYYSKRRKKRNFLDFQLNENFPHGNNQLRDSNKNENNDYRHIMGTSKTKRRGRTHGKKKKKGRKYRASDDEQLNEVVSNVDDQLEKLRESDQTINNGNSDYSKIVGNPTKTKRKGHKKKKKKKKKGKKYRESDDGAETAGKMIMNVNNSNSINYFNQDYNNLKFKVSPEQEEDINKFLKNINEPPQPFNFDIEQYLNPNLIERNPDPPKIKSYYEFDEAEHHPDKRKPGQIYIFNEGVGNEPIPDVKSKRDLLTQRIKAISNKMRMDSFLDHPELYLDDTDTSKVSRSSDPYLQKYSAPLNLDQFKSDNDFIDKFYLLNDGNPNSMEIPKVVHDDVNKINPFDLRIDLDLDKKFRDLKWETDRKFYSDMSPCKTKNDVTATNNNDMPNANEFIFYK